MIANHLWQSTAFAAAAALLALTLRGNHARTRHWVWMAASLKFLAPFAMLAALGSVAGSRTAVRTAAGARLAAEVEVMAAPMEWGPAHGLPVRADPWPDIAFAVWAAGTLVVSARWWRRWRAMRAVVRAARPTRWQGEVAGALFRGAGGWQAEAPDPLCGSGLSSLEIDFPIPVVTSAAAMEPGVFGILRPVLLLPEGIAEPLAGRRAASAGRAPFGESATRSHRVAGERLTAAQLRAILAHELCHVRRRDNLWASAHMVVEALFWFHPLVWWIGARLVEERERACDEAVIAAGEDPEAYAEGILAACKLYLESPLACVAGVGGGNLRQRVERIMGEWAPRELGMARRALLGAAGLVVLVMPMAVGFLRAPVVRAQEAARPKFEVASIKSAEARPMLMVRALPGGRLAADATVRLLMQNAYGLQSFQIADAPGWAGADHYEIAAKAEHDAPRAQVMLMLQTLLEDRFQLRYHRETRELPVYTLSAARGGLRLPAPKEGGCENPADQPTQLAGGRMTPPGTGALPPTPCGSANVLLARDGARMMGEKVPMPELVRILSMVLGRTVVDRTGFTGIFDIRLDFLPDSATPALPPPPPDAVSDTTSPIIFTALQEQLGLKLESGKGPVEVMVIDHVERPSEN